MPIFGMRRQAESIDVVDNARHGGHAKRTTGTRSKIIQGISTKVTAATLATAALTIVKWLVFDKLGIDMFPENVLDAIQVIVIFASGYLVAEKAPDLVV